MSGIGANLNSWIARNRYSALVQYGGAALAVWVALSLWTFSAVLHRNPFALFLAAVLFTARFLGFGPAVFCSLVSTACLEFFVFPPPFSFSIHTGADLERLAVFLAISVFAGSMARQKTLAESRADRTTREMAAIVEYSYDAIYSSRPDGIITSWNRAAERLYGYTAEEAVGSPVARLAPPERRYEVERNLKILNGGGYVAAYRTERMRKNGTRWPVLLAVSPLRNARGEIVGTSAVARDISAEKQSEEAVRRSEKLATAADGLFGLFLGGDVACDGRRSHDFTACVSKRRHRQQYRPACAVLPHTLGAIGSHVPAAIENLEVTFHFVAAFRRRQSRHW